MIFGQYVHVQIRQADRLFNFTVIIKMIHYSIGSKDQGAMDNFLAVLSLVRKPVAKDGFYLFRAVSEQVSFDN